MRYSIPRVRVPRGRVGDGAVNKTKRKDDCFAIVECLMVSVLTQLCFHEQVMDYSDSVSVHVPLLGKRRKEESERKRKVFRS